MKVIIVTGVSNGLGKALFEIFKERNIKLIAIPRRFLPEQTVTANNNRNIHLLLQDLRIKEAVIDTCEHLKQYFPLDLTEIKLVEYKQTLNFKLKLINILAE